MVLVSNTIRHSITTKIMEQYRLYRNEIQFELLDDTILYDIFKHCPTSTRISLSGLGTCSPNGSSAFAALINLCDSLAKYGKKFYDNDYTAKRSKWSDQNQQNSQIMNIISDTIT